MKAKKHLLKSEKILIFSAETLAWHTKKFLLNHPEVNAETCNECSKDKTCAKSVEIALKQLKDVTRCLKKHKI